MNRVVPLAIAGAVVAGVLGLAASAQAEPSAASSPSPAAAPTFQMPFYANQTWKASTYDGHFPNQNSIDLIRGGAATSEGLSVVASAGGTVTGVGEVVNDQGDNFGEYVYIDHGNGWETHYLHIETSLVPGTAVVRGQHLGVIGKYFTMTPHLHYTQLENGVAVRIAFNGTLINVHKNAPKDANGNYPTQNLTSANVPSSCVVTAGFASGSVKCGFGAAVRMAIECELLDGTSKVVRGPFVSAKLSSSAHCGGPLTVLDRWFETS
jgi:murein DD-endopeptidase MepM/ murein hydrolase activator NlpD